MKRPTAADAEVLPLPRRRAFTLLELLVVIAIISVLIGLLVAAVQRVRSASARLACQNNVKQLALGLHQFHDTNNSLPPGHRSVVNQMPYTGWTLDVLPYIEQQAFIPRASRHFGSARYRLRVRHMCIERLSSSCTRA